MVDLMQRVDSEFADTGKESAESQLTSLDDVVKGYVVFTIEIMVLL